jgi:UDPglucose 6-dehydrogenase
MTDTAHNIGIIGGGFVGGATALFSSEKYNVIIYDLMPERCSPPYTTFDDILKKTLCVFICVPTPITTTNNQQYGMCNTKIVEKVIKQLKDANYQGHIIVRSTVPIGFCDSFNVNFMPEFLTEKNWRNDFINNKEWFLGVQNDDVIPLIVDIIQNSQVTNKTLKTHKGCKEMEYIKYFRNCILATKVSFCNEMYQLASTLQINYNEILPLLTQDPRIGSSHTSVPGHDGHKGFGGTCFPKDMASLSYQFKEHNVPSYVISGAIKRNEEIDRPEKDWLNYPSV